MKSTSRFTVPWAGPLFIPLPTARMACPWSLGWQLCERGEARGGRSPRFSFSLDGCSTYGSAGRKRVKAGASGDYQCGKDEFIFSGDYANYWRGQCVSRKYIRAAGNYFSIEGSLAIA